MTEWMNEQGKKEADLNVDVEWSVSLSYQVTDACPSTSFMVCSM